MAFRDGKQIQDKKKKALIFKAFSWSCWADSNRRPHPYQGCALPTELQQHMATKMGLEPTTSSVTGWRSTLLNYGAILVPSMGLEPIRDCSHQPLKLAYLPFHHNGIHYLSHGILSYRSYGESPVAIFSNPPGTIFHSVCFFFSLFWLI